MDPNYNAHCEGSSNKKVKAISKLPRIFPLIFPNLCLSVFVFVLCLMLCFSEESALRPQRVTFHVPNRSPRKARSSAGPMCHQRCVSRAQLRANLSAHRASCSSELGVRWFASCIDSQKPLCLLGHASGNKTNTMNDLLKRPKTSRMVSIPGIKWNTGNPKHPIMDI